MEKKTSAALPRMDSEAIDSALKSELTEEVSETLETLSKRLMKEVPMVTGEGQSLRLRRPDRRLQWGITRRKGVFSMALLVENDNSWALKKATELKEKEGAVVAVSVTGQAHSSRTTNAVALRRERPLRPGLSISHYGGWAGSLGCVVTVDGEPGVCGASHVLGMNNRANVEDKKDWVIQPGIPDSPPLAGNRVGPLTQFVFLAHYSSDPENPANTLDVGLARVDNPRHVPDKNWVRDPLRDRRLSIKGVLPAEELFAHIGEKVYKLGRTTDCTAGVLEFTNVHRYPIKLPDGKAYVYDDIACVKSTGRKPFSEKGDSGAMVYLADGRGIGLIIGGSGLYTFITPLSSCLAALGAELVGVN